MTASATPPRKLPRGPDGDLSARRDRSEFRRQGAVALSVRILGATAQFALNALVARFVGPAGAGEFFLALTAANVAAVLGRVGLDYAIVRFIAAGSSPASERQPGQARAVLAAAVRVFVPASVVATAVAWAVGPSVAVHLLHKPETASDLRWISLAIVPLSVVALSGEALRAVKRIAASQVVQSVAIPSACLLVFLWRAPTNSLQVVWAYSVAGLAGSIVAVFLVSTTPQYVVRGNSFPTRRLLATSLPLFGMAATEFVIAWTGIITLGIVSTSQSVGIYAIASRVSGLIAYALVAANIGLAPKFAELYAVGDLERLGRVARHAAAQVTAVALLPAMACIIAPRLVLGVFGHGFVEGTLALQIMAAGQLVNAVTGSVGFVLVMSGHERVMRNIVTASMVTNVVLNAVLVPLWGLNGAALAAAASTIQQNLLAAFFVYRRLGIVTVPGLQLRLT